MSYRYHSLCVFFITCFVFLGLSLTTWGAEIFVPDHHPNIKAAMNAAVDGDVVIVRDGTYTGPDNIDLRFGTKAITVRSENGPTATIIDARNPSGGIFIGQAFIFENTGSGATLEGFGVTGFLQTAITLTNSTPTIRNMHLYGNENQSISISQSPFPNPKLIDLHIRDNFTFGTGIHIFDSGADLINLIIERNISSFGGGALVVGGESFVSLRNSRVLNNENRSVAQGGGGIIVNGRGRLFIRDSTISGNIDHSDPAVTSAEGGGAFYLTDLGHVQVFNSEITNNTSLRSSGGGFYIKDNASIIMWDTTIANNHAHGGFGGGFYLRNSAEITLIRNVIHSNSTRFNGNLAPGGGIYSQDNAVVNLYNSVMHSNHGSLGSAISSRPGTVLEFYNTTIANNQINNGTGNTSFSTIASAATGLITNTIITADIGTPLTIDGGSFDINHSNIKGTGGSAAWTGSSLLNDLGNNLDVPDIGFVDAANNDFRLQANSPMVDQGIFVSVFYSDVRGSVRPLEVLQETPLTFRTDGASRFDIGAYEYPELNPFSNIYVTGQEGSIVTEVPSTFHWTYLHPFPLHDSRLSGSHTLSFILISEDGELLGLPLHTVTSGQPGVENTLSFTFDETHIGTWRLRIRLAAADEVLGVSEPFTIGRKPEEWLIGEPITPPPNADITQVPDTSFASDKFYWHAASQTLYAIGPALGFVIWKDSSGSDIPVEGENIWPETPQQHLVGSPPVELLPTNSAFAFAQLQFTDSGASVDGSNSFSSITTGHSVIVYAEDSLASATPLHYEVVESILWSDASNLQSELPWEIGVPITNATHAQDCGQGFVGNEVSPYVPAAILPSNGYDRTTRNGPIIPINEDASSTQLHSNDLVIFWYERSLVHSGVCWPALPSHYHPHWPAAPPTIVIASGLGTGSLDPANYQNTSIYAQEDPTQAGYNPNEEHGRFLGTTLYATRNDLNRWDGFPAMHKTSQPYTLLSYQDPQDNDLWKLQAFQVLAEDAIYTFNYDIKAGRLLKATAPLSSDQWCPESDFVDPPPLAVWRDYTDRLWTRAVVSGGNSVTARLYERWQGQCLPWLGGFNPDPSSGFELLPPRDITYNIYWPESGYWNNDLLPTGEPNTNTSPDLIPVLHLGETLVQPKNGLPNITNQCSVEILYETAGEGNNVKLFDMVSEREVDLAELPENLTTRTEQGLIVFPNFPVHLQSRLTYDPINFKLQFKGIFDDSEAGEPVILLNVMTERERDILQSFDASLAWQDVIQALYLETRQQLVGQTELAIPGKALSAGSATGFGRVVLAMQANEEACSPTGLPISVEIIQVITTPYVGEVKVLTTENPFDERVVLRHNGDFGGEPNDKTFEWRYSALGEDGTCRSLDPTRPDFLDIDNWIVFEPTPSNGLAAQDILIEGPGIRTLKDWCYITRYKGFAAAPGGVETFSEWTPPQLYEGWIKRVVDGINPFDQRISSFHETVVDTTVSMIRQAGKRYEGPIALNNSDSNTFGLIEAYETVLRRGVQLSIDGAPAVDDEGVNQQLLLAASRITDLYMLLGNEAYADAVDPTLGTPPPGGEQFSVGASTLFSFKNQVPSLLDEELALLRGRDDATTAINIPPFYNRLPWNFTQSDGEIAYVLNYNILDQEPCPGCGFDGLINEQDAKLLFPQGHGDAWGHYLTAIKAYYRLLKHPFYTWLPRAESVLVAGVPVQVDYLDERQFAQAAAARALTGVELMGRSYQQQYQEDPTQQWQGYEDTEPNRHWGLSDWGQRAGQGAYLDWVTANALLPAEDTVHTGLAKIDRHSVQELHEVATHYRNIQAKLDTADRGLNPLGLAKDAVSFDINPALVAPGIFNKTHFEQIYDHALQVLNNTAAIFDYANQSNQRLRNQQDTLQNFQQTINEREFDFNNRLIEIFGYPYPDDIGPGGAYPSGYNGPDLYHYMYVDPSALMGVAETTTEQFEITFSDFEADTSGTQSTRTIPFHLSTNGLGMVKPDAWTGSRRAPGELQMARSDLFQAIARFQRGVSEYNVLLRHIEDQASLLQARQNLSQTEIQILDDTRDVQISLDSAIRNSGIRRLSFQAAGETAKLVSNATAEGIAGVTGVIAGLASGVIADTLAPVRAAILNAGAAVHHGFQTAANFEELTSLDHQQAKEQQQSLSNILITSARNEFEIQQQLAQLAQSIRQELALRLEVYTLQENMQQMQGRYLAALARGERIMEERLRFRQRTASAIQGFRYKDMSFRVFRNNALQKYDAQFELAARYVYLAAKAYDYETALLGSNSQAGQHFLESIVKQRVLGAVSNGVPQISNGLANVMAELSQNFAVLKGQLGINNPQEEINRFSLRKELFRIRNDETQTIFEANEKWRTVLEQHRVDNLFDFPEFRRYAKSSISPDVRLPGIVIPFSTTISPGLNFFEWPLGPRDSFYSFNQFTTKIHSLGVWFGNYNAAGLSQTPRIYLFPVGVDILRTPNDLETREWQIIDQSLPEPFPLGSNFEDADWIPINDTLFEPLAAIRRYSDFRAYHDSGANSAELTNDSRLIGRSVWNTRWLLIIPGNTLLSDADEGLNTFIHGPFIQGTDERTENGITDILIFFRTYAHSGG